MTGLILERTESISHILGQSLIKVDGDMAGAETAFLAFMRLPGQDGGPPRMNLLLSSLRSSLADEVGDLRSEQRPVAEQASARDHSIREDVDRPGRIDEVRIGQQLVDPLAHVRGVVEVPRAAAEDHRASAEST
jgi:hypothetical protein